jgi:hypothetical protein
MGTLSPYLSQDQLEWALDEHIRARLQKGFIGATPPEEIWARIVRHLLNCSSSGKRRPGRIAAHRENRMEDDLTFSQAMLS